MLGCRDPEDNERTRGLAQSDRAPHREHPRIRVTGDRRCVPQCADDLEEVPEVHRLRGSIQAPEREEPARSSWYQPWKDGRLDFTLSLNLTVSETVPQSF